MCLLKWDFDMDMENLPIKETSDHLNTWNLTAILSLQ